MTRTRLYKAIKGPTGERPAELDPRTHVEGSGLCDFETLCGYSLSGTTWDDEAKGPIDCKGCLDVIRLVRNL